MWVHSVGDHLDQLGPFNLSAFSVFGFIYFHQREVDLGRLSC